ncbi:MAG: M1 family metallopeptidase [Jejuia sp.]
MKRILVLLCFCGNFLLAQQIEYVDFKTAKANITINTTNKEVSGRIEYTFEILKCVDSIYIDAQNIELVDFQLLEVHCHVHTQYIGIAHRNNSNQIIIYNKFKKEQIFELILNYSATPKKSLYFIDWEFENGNKQVWTQGQGKYTSNWLPSIDDMNEKTEFDLSITFDEDYEVISNGKLTDKQIGDSTITWHYNMNQPMPSYLVALAIGKYDKKVEYSKSGVPLEMYYYTKDSLKFEPTYRYTKQIFDFLEEEIGVPYPWQNYKMVPVKDFLYAGMENTSLNIYSDGFVVDSIGFVDKNFVNINAHELAHQWFGDMVTATHGTHHWLQEGFATYYALLAEKEIFGEDYYYWRLYEYAEELLAQDKAGKSTSLLDPKSSSTTFYKKGCWVLHMLREKVGDTAFREAIKNYLEKYQFKNVETDDFISEVEKSSGEGLSEFVEKWFSNKDLHYDEMIERLKKSSFIQEYLMVDCEVKTSKCKEYLTSWISDEAKYKIISQNSELINKESFKNSKKVRKSIAQFLNEIPVVLKADYESLLNDKSYITIETALFNLWRNFPEDRTKYLNQTKDIIGFNDKNVRTLWLTLALITVDFQLENKRKYFEELTDYTSPKYGFEVRQKAFQYLTQIQACNDDCKANLKQAASHYNWRFKKFAKSLLEEGN